MRSRLTLSLAFGAILLGATAVTAAGLAIVSQKTRQFGVANLQIARGDVVRFNNDDQFIHHVYVQSPSFNYESAEQEPGTSVDVSFPKSGTFEVRCLIHPKMLLRVDVR